LVKIVRHSFSEYIKKGELEYHDEVSPQKEKYKTIENRIKYKINDGRLSIVPFLVKELGVKGNILDMGGGTGWLSAELSKFPSVRKISCIDASEHLLRNVAPEIIKFLKGDERKITLVIGDFHKLEFPKQSFDFVIFSASLHHIPEKNYRIVFEQIKKVLKKDGKLIAIREPILPLLVPWRKYEVKRKERLNKTTENIYTRNGWATIFARNGFSCSFIPFVIVNKSSSLINLLRKFVRATKFQNGLFFGYYVMLGKLKKK